MPFPTGNKIKNYISLCLLWLLVSCQFTEINPNRFVGYYFEVPATVWEETIPLGNGRLGMMPDGGIDKETFVLNEISMWSGRKQDTDNPYSYWYLSRIRQLLFEGRNDEAQELMYRTFICKGAGSGLGNGAELPYGSYQLLGNLEINYTYDAPAREEVSGYRRELNLQEAIASVSFKKGTVNYTREAFTSFAADLGVIYLTADIDRSVNFTLTVERPERYQLETIGNDLVMEGQLTNGTDGEGIRYAARTRILLPKEGSLTVENNELVVKNASEVIILQAMATNYFGEDPSLQNQQILAGVERKDYNSLRREHIAAYRELFGRVELDLGFSSREHQPIPERLKAFQADNNDPGLAALYFHFGRYLFISSTRPGSLPPNLQGLWCNTVHTPWNGDYHLNINLQMNHWPAEVCNLSELHEPLIQWTKQQVESGEKTAKVFYNANGWVTHVLGNVWEFTAPGEHPSWGATNTSAAWLCQHLYMHYLYTLDRHYLEEIYPVMKGAALFFVDMLVEDPRNKYLVTAPTTSPENSFVLSNGNEVSICAGSTMDNQLLRELFTNTIEAATILQTDSALVEELRLKRSRLKPTTIGKDGRIMEWLEPYQEAEPTHRHVSHLYGLYPGNEISAVQTPQLAEAARKTLQGRGDQSTGWSMAWKINFQARLRDGDHAWKLIKELLRPCGQTGQQIAEGGGTYPNLFCAHPPFQIDGNLGGCAGIAEMLIQSQDGYVEYLPALPAAWPNGQFKGLKVRGGGEVSAKWKEGLLTEATLKAIVPHRFRIKLPANSENIALKINHKPVSLPVIAGMLEIELKEGEELFIQF
ncbi:MAG: glycoside hydrolase family 95 protein [Tannerellaceae bacterium]|nr:glycoside hydrolase family 95 protein [Tannerellaceae bacterium]